MSAQTAHYFNYFDRQREALLNQFFEFLRFQTISTLPAHRPHIESCARWLAEWLRSLGLEVHVWSTGGHPMVFASHLKAGPDKPTVMLYNHYDVQPVDPLELWKNPPFSPTLIGDEIYARGASDNKGQCFYVMHAVRAMLERGSGKLPVNLKLCIEGEEEGGSTEMYTLVHQYRSKLKADHLYIVDAGLRTADEPAVNLGARGIISMTITVSGSKVDLHSGEHGGIAYNPNRALVELLSLLRAPDGKVQVPGFYDDVRPLTDAERKALSMHFDNMQYRAAFGAMPVPGEEGYAPLECSWARPTVEINGLGGGYWGPGFKTVIPARATAKISCRLVPDQNPEIIRDALERFLQDKLHPSMALEVKAEGVNGTPIRTDPTSRSTAAAAAAYSEIFNKPCSYVLTGGSIPISTELAAVAGADLVFLGYGLPEDNVHAPNEHFSVSRLRRGLATIARTLENLGA